MESEAELKTLNAQLQEVTGALCRAREEQEQLKQALARSEAQLQRMVEAKHEPEKGGEKRAEEGRGGSEERYRWFIANSSEGVWRLELNPPLDTSLPVEEQVDWTYRHGRMAECNDAMARMYGLKTAQDLLGKSLDFMLPSSDPHARAFIASIVQAGYRATEVESEERDAAGNTVYFLNSMAGVVEQGRLLHIWGTQRDITRRKLAEDRLMEQQRLLESVTENASVSLFIMDEHQRCVFMNPAAENLTGFKLEELQGKVLHDVTHHTRPDGSHYPLSECPIDQALPENNQEQGEEVFVHRDGHFYNVAFTASPIRDSSGEAIGTVIEVRDITEEKFAAAALRESEARLRLFIEHAPAAIAMFDREMRYLAASARWKQDYRLDGDLLGRSHYEIFPEMPERWKVAHQRALAGAVLRADEDPFLRPDGTTQWVKWEVRPWVMGNGEVGGILVASEDVSAAVRTKQALLENQAVLRTVTNEAHVGLVMVDRERRYLFANHTYAEILGLPDSDLVGKRLPDVLAHVYDQIGPRLDNAFAGERVTYELRVPSSGEEKGEARFYEVVYEPRVENTTEPYVVVVIVDITERKKMQHTLERLVKERTAELRETVEELEGFSYSIAHDMRAPLRAMQGFSTVLQEEYSEQLGEGKDYLRRIAASANRLDALIQDVLDYSKVLRSELPLSAVRTEEFLSGIVESYPNLHPPNADIRIEKPMPPVLANPAALTQVVSNLLGNAVKFVRPGVKPKVRIWAEKKPGGRVRLWFEDNGIGIPRVAQKRIFTMFQRLNLPGEFEGTGIGLTIVRKAVERMGGKVGVQSEAGKGSQFWIELQEG